MANVYHVRQLDEGTYAIEEKTPINQGLCYLLCGTRQALLIDTGLGYPGLKKTVEGLTKLPVVVANTHAHVDHIGGNHCFGEIWFHEADRPTFALHANPAYTLDILTAGMPGVVRMLVDVLTRKQRKLDTSGNYRYFGDDKVFHLGGRDVEVIPTPGHSPGCVCFLDRGARMLFSGDSVCEWGVLLHFEKESCLPKTYLESMERLKALEGTYDTIWPGHHGYPVEKTYVDEYLTCARRIVGGTAEYGVTQGRRCAKYGRILITLPGDARFAARPRPEK